MKTKYLLVGTLLFIALSIFGCSKNVDLLNTNGQQKINAENISEAGVVKPAFTVGQKYGAGTIFYVDGTGKHGLIVAPNDQWGGPLPWTYWVPIYGSQYILVGTTSAAVGTGRANTLAIAKKELYYTCAATVCLRCTIGGFTDWFLPSLGELNLLYNNRKVVSNMQDSYWTSTESGLYGAYYQYFRNGAVTLAFKGAGNICVRAIRAF